MSKYNPTLPVEGRFYGVEANQQCNEKLPQAKTKALKSGMTLTYRIGISAAYRAPCGFSAPRWNVLPAASRLKKVIKRTSLYNFLPIPRIRESQATLIPGVLVKIVDIFSAELLKLLDPVSICYIRMARTKSCVKVIGKNICEDFFKQFDKRGCVNFYVETPTRHMANWGLRSPLSSCKNLSAV